MDGLENSILFQFHENVERTCARSKVSVAVDSIYLIALGEWKFSLMSVMCLHINERYLQ